MAVPALLPIIRIQWFYGGAVREKSWRIGTSAALSPPLLFRNHNSLLDSVDDDVYVSSSRGGGGGGIGSMSWLTTGRLI